MGGYIAFSRRSAARSAGYQPLTRWHSGLRTFTGPRRQSAVLGTPVSRGAAVPVVGTFRLDDLEVAPLVAQWFDRVQRFPETKTVELGPLTRAETQEQLVLLGEPAARANAERIFSRSHGLPLFTEQLAVHSIDDQPLPRRLADLLDRRLEGLQPDAYVECGRLASQTRPVLARVLGKVAGVEGDALNAVARELDRRHLLAIPWPVRSCSFATLFWLKRSGGGFAARSWWTRIAASPNHSERRATSSLRRSPLTGVWPENQSRSSLGEYALQRIPRHDSMPTRRLNTG